MGNTASAEEYASYHQYSLHSVLPGAHPFFNSARIGGELGYQG